MRILLFAFLLINLDTISLGQSDSLNGFNSNGQKVGYWIIYFDQNGKLVNDSSIAIYYRYTYYVNGNDISKIEWRGKKDIQLNPTAESPKSYPTCLHGQYLLFDKKGNLKSSHVFNQGKYVSYRSYYPDGTLREYYNFQNLHYEQGEAEPHTYCKREYKQNGEVNYYYMRQDGSGNSWEFIESKYDSTNIVTYKVEGDSSYVNIIYYNGDKFFRQVGAILVKGQNPILHGTYTNYYSNGQKKSEGNYDHNTRVGVWRNWAIDGTEIQTTVDLNSLNKTDAQGEKTGWWLVYLDKDLKILDDSIGATHCMYNYYTGKFYHYKFGTGGITTDKQAVQYPVSDTLKIGKFKLLNGEYKGTYASGATYVLLTAQSGVLTEYKEYYEDGKLKNHFIYSPECGAPIRICIKTYDKNGKLTYDGYNFVPQDLKKNNSSK